MKKINLINFNQNKLISLIIKNGSLFLTVIIAILSLFATFKNVDLTNKIYLSENEERLHVFVLPKSFDDFSRILLTDSYINVFTKWVCLLVNNGKNPIVLVDGNITTEYYTNKNYPYLNKYSNYGTVIDNTNYIIVKPGEVKTFNFYIDLWIDPKYVNYITANRGINANNYINIIQNIKNAGIDYFTIKSTNILTNFYKIKMDLFSAKGNTFSIFIDLYNNFGRQKENLKSFRE
jgi:hypothetical protein